MVNAGLGSEVLRAAGVAAIFLGIFAVAELWRRFGSPRPEWTRKLVHLGGGLVSLALPWLVSSHWTVLALGALLGGLLLLTRRMGLLDSVHGVERSSEGAIYFPAAIYLVFLLAADQPILYLISVLTLVVSDALAALVGTAYGRITYRVETDRRSVEGSAVFFLATFLGVHLPLLLLTEVEPDVSVLVGLQIALLVTILEAISLNGADNLIVPGGTYLLLLRLTPQPAQALLWQLLVQVGILAVLFLLVWRLWMLTASGTLAASLFFYAAWSLGGTAWLTGAAIALAAFAVILRFAAEVDHGPSARYQVLAVFYTAVVPAAVLLLNDVMRTALRHPAWLTGDPLFAMYAGTLTGQLALLCLVFWEGTPWLARPRSGAVAGSLAIGLGVMIPVALLTGWGEGPTDWVVLATIPTLSLALYLLGNRLAAAPRERPWDGRLRAACVGIGALACLPFVLPVGG